MAGTVGNHPYMPRDLHLPDFVPNLLTQSSLLGVYGIASLLVVTLIWIVSGIALKKSKVDKLLLCWWAFTGLTHIILEGYFAFSPEFFKDNTGNFLAEVWKEYSKGDSRYAARDAGVVAVESITAVVGGPACLLALYAIAAGKSYSYILQFAISLGQLYGCAVYYITSFLEGDKFAASPYYYKIYFIGANASWIVIPTIISVHCWNKICAAVHSHTHKKTKIR